MATYKFKLIKEKYQTNKEMILNFENNNLYFKIYELFLTINLRKDFKKRKNIQILCS